MKVSYIVDIVQDILNNLTISKPRLFIKMSGCYYTAKEMRKKIIFYYLLCDSFPTLLWTMNVCDPTNQWQRCTFWAASVANNSFCPYFWVIVTWPRVLFIKIQTKARSYFYFLPWWLIWGAIHYYATLWKVINQKLDKEMNNCGWMPTG